MDTYNMWLMLVELFLIVFLSRVQGSGVFFSSSNTQVSLAASGSTTIGRYDDDTWPPVQDPDRISVEISYIRLLSHVALTLEEFRIQGNEAALFEMRSEVELSVAGISTDGHLSVSRDVVQKEIHNEIVVKNYVFTRNGTLQTGRDENIQVRAGDVRIEWLITNSTSNPCSNCFTTLELGIRIKGHHKVTAKNRDQAAVTLKQLDSRKLVKMFGAKIWLPEEIRLDNRWSPTGAETLPLTATQDGDVINANIRFPKFETMASYALHLRLEPVTPEPEEDSNDINPQGDDPGIVSLSEDGNIIFEEEEDEDIDSNEVASVKEKDPDGNHPKEGKAKESTGQHKAVVSDNSSSQRISNTLLGLIASCLIVLTVHVIH